jgi:hypothetical protein
MSDIRIRSADLRALADDLDRLARRLDLGQANYLRGSMRVDVLGHAGLADALDDFENEWDMGRDRIMSALTSIAAFMVGVADTYEQVEAALAGGLTADPAAGGASTASASEAV